MKLTKNSRRILIILGVAIIFLISYLLASLFLGSKPQPALDITGPDGEGVLHSLSDHFGKEPSVLLFFDTETEKATELLNQLIALKKDYDFALVAVATGENLNEQKAALKEMDIDPALILFDVEGEMAETYNVNATPVTYFIDKNGIVQEAFLSSISAKTLKKTLSALD